MTRKIKLTVTLFFICCALRAQTPDSTIRRKLDQIFLRDIPANAPGTATAVIKQGQVFYSRVGGYARMDSMSLITPRTRFNLASNGKQFTALAILMLECQNLLSLEDELSDYFPSLYEDITSPLTLEHLLTHTSGIRDVYDLWSLQGYTWWEKYFTNDDALNLLAAQKTLNFEPGSAYAYSNSNYILLAGVVEKVTGIGFSEFTRNMFDELEMTSTAFEDDYTRIQDPIALPYFNFDRWQSYDWIWNIVGDGNLFSPLTDQIRWEITLQTNQFPENWTNAIKKSQLPVENLPGNYGYGIEYGDFNGNSYRFHEGSTGAWKATTIRFDEFTIITMSNSGKVTPDTQSREMARVILGNDNKAPAYDTIPSAPGEYIREDELIGMYETPKGSLFTFTLRDDGLYLIRNGRNDVRLQRESANIFYQEFDPAFKQEFKRDSLGRLTVTAYYFSHAPYTLSKIESDWSGFDNQKIPGSFYNEELDIRISVVHKEGRQYLIRLGEKQINGLLIRPTEIRFNNYRLDLSRVSDDIVFLTTDRSSAINFVRRPGQE